MPQPEAAIVICTRNRVEDLARTVHSISCQQTAFPRLVFIVDASDDTPLHDNRETLNHYDGPWIRHVVYEEKPSLPRQRNVAIDCLPPSVQIVHFLDDDVTLRPGYFQAIERTFAEHEDLAGIGGVALSPPSSTSMSSSSTKTCSPWWRRLFLLDGPHPGHVLLSGSTTPAQQSVPDVLTRTAWLAGCSCSYRRSVFATYRFDPILEGYSPMEDTDFSYRVCQHASLAVEPSAQLIHHVSPINRYDATKYRRAAVIHRYWFVEKNIRHPLRKPAFWWTTLGELLATVSSGKPEKWNSLRGLWQGICAVWHRTHPLLNAPSGR